MTAREGVIVCLHDVVVVDRSEMLIHLLQWEPRQAVICLVTQCYLSLSPCRLGL